MKKILNRIAQFMITFSCLFYNYCYADAIDPYFEGTPRAPKIQKPEIQVGPDLNSIASLIFLGIVIAIVLVIVISIIAIVKNKNSNQSEVKNEEKDNDNL